MGARTLTLVSFLADFCGLSYTADLGTVESPNYLSSGSVYPMNLIPNWCICTIALSDVYGILILQKLHFDLEESPGCINDYLLVSMITLILGNTRLVGIETNNISIKVGDRLERGKGAASQDGQKIGGCRVTQFFFLRLRSREGVFFIRPHYQFQPFPFGVTISYWWGGGCCVSKICFGTYQKDQPVFDHVK